MLTSVKKVPPRISFNDFRSAQLLEQAVVDLANKHGPESVALLSLTFRKSKLTSAGYSPKEAHKKYIQLGYHLRKQFADHIRVTHATKRGQIHIHVVAAVGSLIGPHLTEADRKTIFKSERKLWRKIIKKHGAFGFLHFERLRKNAYALGTYLGHWLRDQYLLPTFNPKKRPHRWKGVKTWACSRGIKVPWGASLASQPFKQDALRLAIQDGFQIKKSTKGRVDDSLWNLVRHFLKIRYGPHWAIDVSKWQWEQTQSDEQDKRQKISAREMARIEAQLAKALANGKTIMRRFKSSYAPIP